MGKISGRELADRYGDFHYPAVKVLAEGREIPVGDSVYLESVEVHSSLRRDPDMAVLKYRAARFAEGGPTALERNLSLGRKIEVRAGYGNSLSRIFLGYLHEVDAADFLQDYVEYTLICLDVKGLMRKNSLFQTSGARKTQQILKEILEDGSYGFLIEKKRVSALPECMNGDCVIKGETHYEWLCGLAEYLNYEFFCGRGELFFRKAGEGNGELLELTSDYGLQWVRAAVSMAEQTGSISVWGYNRKDEKFAGTARFPGVQGPFTQKLKQVLQGFERSFWDMGLETGEQANWRAAAMAERAASRCFCLEAAAIGVPELQPGVCVAVADEGVESLSGTFYAEEVRHLLDGSGYRTIAAGSRKGG